MKFWQKAFLCVIAFFLIAFDVESYLFVQKSYELSQLNEISTSENEYYIIKKSLTERLTSVAHLYTSLNAENIKQYIDPYGQYYKNQNIYLAVYVKDSLVYTSMENVLPPQSDFSFAAGERYIQSQNIENKPYLFITSFLDILEGDIKLVYIKGQEHLMIYRKEMVSYSVKTCVVVSICLSGFLIMMLLRLTRPIRKLNKGAEEITKGNYQKRVKIDSRDEIGEFAANFNIMADHVEAHITKLWLISEEKQRFIDNFSHEMRTPIAAILGYGELLKHASIDEEQRLRAINYIISQGTRLQNLSSKLLQLSSMRNDILVMKPVSIRNVVNNAQQSLYTAFEEKDISFEAALFPYDIILGDTELLESLFQNLFENSIRVLGQNGRIKVNSEIADNSICVMIVDDGPGMPPEELHKIQEPFYRIDKARTRIHGGAGLGLSICKQICDAHGARLVITSEVGRGTQIKIYFTSLIQPDDDSSISML